MADKAPGGSQKGSGKVRPFRGAARGPAARSAAGGVRPRPAGGAAGPGSGEGAGRGQRGLPRPCVPAPALLLRGATAGPAGGRREAGGAARSGPEPSQGVRTAPGRGLLTGL